MATWIGLGIIQITFLVLAVLLALRPSQGQLRDAQDRASYWRAEYHRTDTEAWMLRRALKQELGKIARVKAALDETKDAEGKA